MAQKQKLFDVFFDTLEEVSLPLAVVFAILYFLDRGKFYLYLAIFLLFMVGLVVLARWLKSRRSKELENWHGDKEILGKLRRLHPDEFEEYVADLYGRLGYKTEVVGGAYDGGVDVIATRDGIKHYIQCKKYITRQVGVAEMREFYGTLADHLSKGKGIFITTNIFTTEAEKFAEGKPIELLDGDHLLKLIKSSSKTVIGGLPQEKNCPACGGQLILRRGKFGEFFGCSNYPKCRHTERVK